MELTNDKRPLVQRFERRLPALGHALCERPRSSTCSNPTRNDGVSEPGRITPDFTYGWNAGFSEKAGVGKVVGYLEGLGARDVDLDQVHGHARLAGASRHLSNEQKVRWCKSVVEFYQRERAPRNAARRRKGRRGAHATKHTIFILRTYPEGMWGPVVTRWYRADPPTTWDDAKRRLIAAGLLDVRILRPTEWKLVADPPFRIQEERVRPLPGGAP